jgi:hypothetical protein
MLRTILGPHRRRELERLDREYATMTTGEREVFEAVRRSGAAGQRDVLVEIAARRSEDDWERRPSDHLEPPAARLAS